MATTVDIFIPCLTTAISTPHVHSKTKQKDDMEIDAFKIICTCINGATVIKCKKLTETRGFCASQLFFTHSQVKKILWIQNSETPNPRLNTYILKKAHKYVVKC